MKPNNDTIGGRIHLYRRSRCITQAQLAEKVGVCKSTVSQWENNLREPDQDAKEAIADALNIYARDLIPDKRNSKKNRIKVIGSVAAGQPILAEQTYDEYIETVTNADYALKIEGNSMHPTYMNGDIIFIREQSTIDYDGQVLVVLFDDSATVKHVYRQPNGLLLRSDNPEFDDMFKPFSDYNTVRILGKVCGYTRMYRE